MHPKQRKQIAIWAMKNSKYTKYKLETREKENHQFSAADKIGPKLLTILPSHLYSVSRQQMHAAKIMVWYIT